MTFGAEELLAQQRKRHIERVARDSWKYQDAPHARASHIWKFLRRI